MDELQGLKVLELANILAGPAVGQFCAELGAEVIKVEHPQGGDPTRSWHLAVEDAGDDVSAYFSCVNWGKRSIALDFARDADVVRQLTDRADVVIVGFKPGDELKFGLDYDTLAAPNPELIYLQLTAYGVEDPRPGFDAILQAESGFTHLNGNPDGDAVKMPVALVDLLAAHQLKEGLLLALLKRAQGRGGSYVATSLLRSAVASLANQATNYLHAGVVPERMGSEHPNIAPYGTLYQTSGGDAVLLAVGTERQWRGLLDVLGLTHLADDERFSSNTERVRNRQVLNALLGAAIAERDAAELLRELHAAKVPAGGVHDMAAVFEQSEARAQLLQSGRGVRSIALTGDIEGRDALSPPPHLDEHREQILEELNRGGA